jgi:hypothetical protein
MLERLGRDKHSSILQKSVNCDSKKFYIIGPCTIKIFLTIIRGASTINILLILAFALATVINYDRKRRSKLWHHSDNSIGVTYNCYIITIQATRNTDSREKFSTVDLRTKLANLHKRLKKFYQCKVAAINRLVQGGLLY